MPLGRLFKVLRSNVEHWMDGGSFSDEQVYERYKRYKDEFERRFQEEEGYDDEYEEAYTGRSTSRKDQDKETSYFKILEMKPTSEFQKIKKQYRKMMMKYHPDRYQEENEKKKMAMEIAAKLNEAYEYFEERYG